MAGNAAGTPATPSAAFGDGSERVLSVNRLLDLQLPTSGSPLDLASDDARFAFSVRPARAKATGLSATELYDADGVPVAAIRSGNRVVVVETATGNACGPFPAADQSWGPRWSPDGGRLAAYVAQGGRACLGLWHQGDGAVRLLREALVRPAFGWEVPQWTPDGREIVVKLWPASGSVTPPASSEPVEPPVIVLAFDPARGDSAPLPPLGDWWLGDLGVVDATTGAVRRLGRDWVFVWWRVAPDGRAVALTRLVETDGPREQNYYDLVVVPLDGSPARVVAERASLAQLGLCVNWSPDSRVLAYTTEEGDSRCPCRRLFVVPADGTAAPRALIDPAVIDLRQHPSGLRSDREPPRWSEDGRTIYCCTPGGVWACAADGGGGCRLLGAELGRELRFWAAWPGAPTVGAAGDPTGLVVTRDPVTKRQGVARLDLGSGVAVLLAEFDRACDESGRVAAADGSGCYLLLEAADHPPEVWRVDGGRPAAARVHALNPALDDVALGTGRLVAWRALDGEVRRGALLLPPGYREGRRVPLIVHVYGGALLSNRLHQFGFYAPCVYDHAQLLAGRGYAVLCPDMPMVDRDPLRQLPGLVLPAVDRLVEMGIADPRRLGVMGHSYGAYSTLGLLTQTDRFRAAVASAGLYDLPDAYGVVHKGVSLRVGWAETGLGGTLWEKRDAYIENSPLYYLDRVRTPLLLIHGAEDRCPVAQAEAVFGGLRRLGRRVELRRYRDGDHHLDGWAERDLRDAADRVLAWFDEHLAP